MQLRTESEVIYVFKVEDGKFNVIYLGSRKWNSKDLVDVFFYEENGGFGVVAVDADQADEVGLKTLKPIEGKLAGKPNAVFHFETPFGERYARLVKAEKMA